MNTKKYWIGYIAALLLLVPATAFAGDDDTPSGKEIVEKVLETDAWGMTGAKVKARAIVKRDGKKRTLSFRALSDRYDGLLTRSIVRFDKPADIAGYGFLQIQKGGSDDDRYLYMPELKKARRIAASKRGDDFMGTDFSYADLDRRDLRDSKAKVSGTKKLGKYKTWFVKVKPRSKKSQYSKIEMWVSKDNFVPIAMKMYDKSGDLAKTMVAKEVQKIQGKWFITRTIMQDHQADSKTELLLEKVVPKQDVPKKKFTVRALEKN